MRSMVTSIRKTFVRGVLLVALAPLGALPPPALAAVPSAERTATRAGDSLMALPPELRPVVDQAFARDAGAAPAPMVTQYTEDQKIIASDGARMQAFGHSVALSGDIAMVGATDVRPSDYSAVYVFTRSNGVWTEKQILHAADGTVGDKANFGASIAIRGDTAIIGAVGAKVNGNAQQGAAFIFKQQPNGSWVQTAKLIASDGTANNWFGQSVALSGSSALVSGYGASVNGNLQQGAAYLFTESNGTWTQTQKLVSDDGGPNDQFSYAVAFSDTNILISAKRANNGYDGALYVFENSGGVWTQAQRFLGAAGANMGQSLAAQGNRAVAGATNPYNQGAAYVFSKTNGTWSRTAELRPGTSDTSLNFGYAVALSGSAILVGANRPTVNGQSLAGAGYLFTESNGTWSLVQQFIASDALANDSLGESVALEGTTALVASARVTVNGDFLRGAGYFYTAQTGISPAAAVITPSALTFTLAAGASGSKALTIGNNGDSDLTYRITEGANASAIPGNAAAAQETAAPTSTLGQPASTLSQSGAAGDDRLRGAPVLLADTMFSQMVDNSPGTTGASCGAAGVKTAANSWWRRFYFNEHAQIGAAANITGVTVSSGSIEAASGGPVSLPVTINLYTIAHTVPADTLPVNALTLIGSGSGTVVNGLVSTTIPVLGTVNDTVGKDLVVEYHTDGNATGGKFFPGANSTQETHPTFFSAPECSINVPTKAADLNFPNFHLTMVVNAGPLTSCQNPVDIPWLSETPTSGTVAGGGQANVTVTANAGAMAPGIYTANVCVATNDPQHELVAVPVSLTVTGNNPPAATVTPASLSFTVAADATATRTVNIANAVGSNALTWSAAAHAAEGVKLLPRARTDARTEARLDPADGRMAVRSSRRSRSSHAAPWAPIGADGSLTFQLDDGTYETAFGVSDDVTQNSAVWINRFAPPAGTAAYTIDSISIAWPDAETAQGDLAGKSINLVVYYDADSDGDPTNAVRLGVDTLVTIGGPDVFENYPTNFSVPGDGDVYIGFVDAYASGGATPPFNAAAFDVDGPPSGYVSSNFDPVDADITTLANNDLTISIYDLSGGNIPGVFMVRATGTTGGTGGACTGPVVPWLTASPVSGSVNGGQNANVAVTVTPYAGALQAGNHSAVLCLTTNDPARPQIAIPVDVTVTPAQAPAPAVTKAFAPSSIVAGTSSTLTLTLSNAWPAAATLNAALTDSFPTGLVAAATPNASTTCTGGSASATAGGSSVSLAAGAKIPANGTCTVTVNVTSTTAGSYVNTIAAGALQTDRGNNTQAANATLAVTAVVVGPIAQVTPSPLTFTVQAGATGTSPLTIGNSGDRNLSYSIAESMASRNPPSYKTAAAAKHVDDPLRAAATLAQGSALGRFGQPLVLADRMISQMADNTPGEQGVSCGVQGVNTADNSWWRRFYFNEHPQVGARANIASVTISSGSNGPSGMPITINLYTIAHGTPVNTIPTSGLTLIGTASTTIDSGLVSLTVPVTGTVDDTVGKDLVVEYHTDGTDDGQFFPGANATAETHPTFLSSSTCGVAQPAPTSTIGFPNFHLTMVVNIDDGTPAACRNPSDIPWLSETPASGTVLPGASADVAVTANAGALAQGTYSANLCVTTNDAAQPVIAVPVNLTVTAGPITDRVFCDGFDGTACANGGASTEDDIVVSGPLDLLIPQTLDGLYIDFVNGQSSPTEIPGYDFNPYRGGGVLLFYWGGDMADANGGFANTPSGPHRLLHSGALVGPGSMFSAAANGVTQETADFIGGVDGYIGVRFFNESTGTTNYGYVHIRTSAPNGFPATILDYAYNKRGGPITVP